MINMPQRSVTRFFIPLIDVLILMFGIFLLMPYVQAPGADRNGTADQLLAAVEREELKRLRQERRTEQDVAAMRVELERLRRDKLQTLQQRLAIRVLEIDGNTGKLYFYDPQLPVNRRIEVTADNVAELIRRQRDLAGNRELYFLIRYPRPETGFPTYPLQEQRQEYDRWLADVAHGYDNPVRSP
jgi:hypothetical protein